MTAATGINSGYLPSLHTKEPFEKQEQGNLDHMKMKSASHKHLNETEQKNESSTDFILLWLFPCFRYPYLLFLFFLFIYIIAFMGKSILILLIWLDSHLHTPMYFLLSQLSFIDLAYISSTVPKMVTNYYTGKKSISCFACATQLLYFLTLGLSECILLILMAYHHYVAVCNTLRYKILMNPKVCLRMASGAWSGGSLTALVHTIYPMNFPICGSREINHYFCEMPAILRMSCVDIPAYEMVKFVSTIVFLLIPFFLSMVSYTLIFLSDLRMNSPKGSNKALATCFSHLTVVSLFIYMTPTSSHTPEQDQNAAVLGTIMTPIHNPLIYSLRSKEVVGALRKCMERCGN
ncbi:olfactory receptor 2T27-like [Mustela putorius furo]|uniref:Olfactory receptor 2T27-like n=1 Tax=Mustela putorius furo TaxID=9669 RepID=A0A8U0TBH1_MUSPF|nr:olfactory receptor 2T27-like [Mustela putorius furo]